VPLAACFPSALAWLDQNGLSQPHPRLCSDSTRSGLGGGHHVYKAAAGLRISGWHLSRDIDTRLALAALNAAIIARCPSVGLIHHSDRGVQYANGEYVARLLEIGANPSMSKAGCPYDNAKAESFFKTLKKEEVYLNQYQNFEEARANLGTFLEDVYNQKRLHSSLGYLPPIEFEEQFIQEKLTAPLTYTSKN
jgi:transposase InsO family protein